MIAQMPLYRNTYNGAERVAEALGYPWIEVDEEAETVANLGGDLTGTHIELSAPTADAIILDVGNDAELAQMYLDEEEARETPRTSLIAKLERIIRNAES